MKMNNENEKQPEEPPSTISRIQRNLSDVEALNNLENLHDNGIFDKIMSYFRHKPDSNIRDAIEEYIENETSNSVESELTDHEKTLLSNVLDLHTMCAADVMIPRADIVGINEDITKEDLFKLLAEKQYSRFPVYKDTLDNIIGSVHIKDIMASIARGEKFDLTTLIRDINIVSPSMYVLNLLTQMRLTRKHMVLVVDEFGGIDGLVTIGDLIEAIVGEIDDEHNIEEQPEIKKQDDGSLIADARFDIDEFEELYGKILTEEEREENDTLGGLMLTIAQRVPARGEVLRHDSGLVFEILDADPRRVKRLRIRNISKLIAAADES